MEKGIQPPIIPMKTDKEAPLFNEKSDNLIGCAMAVHNGIGSGFD